MEATTVKFTKPVGNKGIFLPFGILVLFVFVGGCDAYDMENYCNEEFSFIWKTEYQIKLDLNDNNIYKNTDIHYPYNEIGYCETTFEAWITRYPKFMFYFEDLNLDCDKGHLEFYVGESTDLRVTGLEGDICGAAKPQGVFTVGKQYFRIKYVPKRSQYINGIFSIIITSYGGKDSCPSYAHLCANSRCIDGDIACNGYDSCGDGSGCDLSTGAIVGIIIGGLVGLALIISVVICCICCSRRSGNTPGTVQSTPVTYSGYTQQVYSQPINRVNQGSLNNPSHSPYPVATATGITASGSDGNIRPTYGFNQGPNYPNNQTSYANVSPNTSQHVPDVSNSNAAPPQYSELFANSGQNKQQL